MLILAIHVDRGWNSANEIIEGIYIKVTSYNLCVVLVLVNAH